MSVTFAQEKLTAALLAEAAPLLIEHWKEVSHYSDIPLDVDQKAYLLAAMAGSVRCFTVRKPSGVEAIASVLVGYAIFFVRKNLHYKGSLQAAQDVLYLDPSVRGGTGYRFIAFCDEQLKAEGCQVVYQHIKAAHNFGPLLERQGYELVDLIYAKRLDT